MWDEFKPKKKKGEKFDLNSQPRCAGLNGKNGLKYFPLFLMGKLVSVLEQIGARPPHQNGLWSSTEVPLYNVSLWRKRAWFTNF